MSELIEKVFPVSEIITEGFRALNPILITEAFLLLIFGVCVYSVFKAKSDLSPFLVSLGIIGTFCGIFSGLIGFDTHDITSSVPKLLEGLKVAFITSIAGMIFALLTSVIIKFKPQHITEGEVAEDVLRKIFLEQREQNKKVNKNTMVLDQRLKDISNLLDKFLQKISKAATEEIISALESVIKDFNNNLTEQFGDNFKKLNEAVVNMIEWQEKYKNHIEKIEAGLQTSIKSLEENTKYTNELVTQFQKMSDVSDQLETTIQANQNQIQNLESHLQHLKNFGDDVNITVESINEFSKTIKESLSNQSEGLKELSSQLNSEIERSMKHLNEALTTSAKNLGDDYQEFLENIKPFVTGEYKNS